MTRWIANWLLPLVLSSFPPMNSGPKSRSPIRFGSLAQAELQGHPFHLPRILERSSPAGSWKTTGQWKTMVRCFRPEIGSKIREVTYLRDTSWSLEPLQSRRPKQLWVKTSSKWFKRWSLSLAVQVILRMWMQIYKEDNLLKRFCQNLNVWNV